MRGIDFSSWQSLFATLLGLALVTLIGMGIRLMMMFAIQQRRERMNRQINERLRTLIAAYKVLGGSFTGDLSVDPRHMRDIRRGGAGDDDAAAHARSDRARRIRDALNLPCPTSSCWGRKTRCAWPNRPRATSSPDGRCAPTP
ncbi:MULTISPECIES: hypothetical protein [unclassified Brevundimonas]